MAEFLTPMTRPEARKLGLIRYFTGKPCKNGHLASRWVHGAKCSECQKVEAKSERFLARQKAYRDDPVNKRIKKDQLLQSNYGITIEEYDALVERQNGRCAVCSVKLDGGKGNQGAVVDHCHPTGRVRGILCNQCNRGLGFFRDSPYILSLALKYLKAEK